MVDATHESDDGAVVALSVSSDARAAVYVRFVVPAPVVRTDSGYRDALPFDRDGLIRAALVDIGRSLRRPPEWAQTVALTPTPPRAEALRVDDLALLLLAGMFSDEGVVVGP